MLLSRTDSPGDAELIAAVRGGDVDAYGVLFARHVEAARRLGRQLVRGADVDDLVSEAFAKVLGVLQRGGGPDLAFRAYLLTAVRRLHVDRIRQQQRVRTTDDMTPFDPGVPFRDTAVEGFESSAAAKAFASLPERWQLVLWHTEVEGQKPADIAPLLGMSANSVSALAYRAREGLRQAFLGMHVQELDDADCEWTHQHLGPFVRGGLSKRDATKVTDHLQDCRRCTAIYLELSEVNSSLAGVLGPLVLGSAAAGYLTGGGALLKGGVLTLMAGRARDFVTGHAAASAVAGVAATAVLGSLVYVGVRDHAPTAPSTWGEPQAESAPGPSPGVVAPGRHFTHHHPAARGGETGEHPAAGVLPGAPGPTTVPGTPPSAPTHPQQPPQHQQPHQSQPPADPGPSEQPLPALGATVSLTQHGKGAYLVALTVTGATSDASATVAVTGDTGSAVVTHDARCTMSEPEQGLCDLTTTPAVLVFKANDPHGDGALRFVITRSDGSSRTLRVLLS